MIAHRPSCTILAAALFGLTVAGCGQAVYEQRLENTKRYYAHLGQLNENLSSEWKGTEITLRPPVGFALIPAPQKSDPAADAAQPPAARDAPEQTVLDERQPNYVNLDLPGLVSAWKWEPGNLEGADKSKQTSYLYVLSNQEMGTNPELRDKALKFHDRTLSDLASTLEAKLPRDDKSNINFVSEQYPPNRASFVAQVTYDSITLETDVSNDRAKRSFACYLFTQGDVQVTVLFVYSDVAEHQDLLLKRIPLCLETLTVAGDKIGVPATTINSSKGAKGGGF
ncbi:MAG: hypothetical protein HZA46_23600 [Planctomycetales bacterium]|nr:hypothetical protein [Planctomycetales bacterium]